MGTRDLALEIRVPVTLECPEPTPHATRVWTPVLLCECKQQNAPVLQTVSTRVGVAPVAMPPPRLRLFSATSPVFTPSLSGRPQLPGLPRSLESKLKC